MTQSDRIKQFDNLMGETCPKEFRQWLIEKGFFTAPASTKYHGAYEGGLFDHSFAVAKYLVSLTVRNNLQWEKPNSPLIVGMFHDLCKIDNYVHPVAGYANSLAGQVPIIDDEKWEYNKNTLFTGHGTKSVLLLSQFYNLTEEEVACITYHMGAFTEKEEWTHYTGAVHKYANVLWTHQADMLASHVEGV